MLRFQLIMLLGVLLAACGGTGGTIQPVSPSDGVEMTLFYNDVSLVLYNGGDVPLTQTNRLALTRGAAGAGGDDFSGDSIPGDELGAGACVRIMQQGRTPLTPPQCSEIEAEEFLSDPAMYFWRAEPIDASTFEVRYDGTPIAQCNTVERGTIDECRFYYPAPVEE